MRISSLPHGRARCPRALGRLLAAATLIGAVGCGGGGGGGSSASPLFVTATDPMAGTTGVARNAHAVVTFSMPLDPTSVHPASALTLGNFIHGGVSGSTTIVADGTGRTLEFTPTTQMYPGEQYQITVAATLRSTSGDVLGGSRIFVFTTLKPVSPLPSTALRETAGLLDTGRRNHAAALLYDGRVLVCGGFIQDTVVTDRAELFSPPSEVFLVLANRMRLPRAGFTATRLNDGRVLLAGGYYEISPGTLNITNSAEIFDPGSATFYDTGAMAHPRADHAALALPDGRVLVTGGSELLGAALSDHATAEVYDPATGLFSAWPMEMSHTRAVHQMVDCLDGRWLLVGGSNADLRPEMLDTTTGVFTPFAPAPADHARFGAAAAAFASGNVSVAGGEAFGDVLLFNRGFTQMVNSGSTTTVPRSYATATRVAPDWVLLAGGFDVTNGGATLSTCDLVVEGGVAGSATFATDLHFTTGIANHTATSLAEGRVLFVGGYLPGPGTPQSRRAYLFKYP